MLRKLPRTAKRRSVDTFVEIDKEIGLLGGDRFRAEIQPNHRPAYQIYLAILGGTVDIETLGKPSWKVVFDLRDDLAHNNLPTVFAPLKARYEHRRAPSLRGRGLFCVPGLR